MQSINILKKTKVQRQAPASSSVQHLIADGVGKGLCKQNQKWVVPTSWDLQYEETSRDGPDMNDRSLYS